MGKTILLRRGTAGNLPDLQEGEPGFSTDNEGLYIGSSVGTAETASYIGGGVYVDALQHEPNTFTQATIDAALTAIGTSDIVTLLLRPGTWVVSSNADWSTYTNVTFKLPPGAIISHDTFTVNIPNLVAGLYQVFDGTGAVTLSGSTNEAYPEWWGAVADGTTDDSAAIQAAIDSGAGVAKISSKTYAIEAIVETTDGTAVVIQGNGYSSQIKKMYDGDMISLGKLGELRDLYLNGNGATYTGRGVYITTGALDNYSWRKINNCDILNTESYGIEFEGNRSGYASQVTNSRVVPTGTTAGIKLPTLGVSESNGNRMFVNVWSYGNILIDPADSNNTIITGCQGFFPLAFSTFLAKCVYSGGRYLIGDGGFTIEGTANVIVGNTINASGALGVTFGTSMAQCQWKGNALASGIPWTDNCTGSSDANEINLDSSYYYPVWTAGSALEADPDIGDGTLAAQYIRRGQYCNVNINGLMGSTTTYGTNYWGFSVPYTAARGATGTVRMLDVAPAETGSIGVAYIPQGTAIIYVYLNESGFFMQSTKPWTWAEDDQFTIDIEYLIL